LEPNALQKVAKAIMADPNLDYLYSGYRRHLLSEGTHQDIIQPMDPRNARNDVLNLPMYATHLK